VRRWLRDAVVETLAALPGAWKHTLVRRFPRPVLWLLFRLERERLPVTRAGPRGCRFTMRLNWCGHTDFVLGIYEPEVTNTLRRFVRPGDCCIDVGAHIGYSTLVISRLVGEQGQVVAYEPFPDNFAVLQENMERNSIRNAVLRCLALGEQAGELVLEHATGEAPSSTPSAIGYAVEGPRAKISVGVDTLDAEVRRLRVAPRLVKIDVEGAELAVLRGARETLRKARPVVLVEIHDWGSNRSSEVLNLLRCCGYRVERIGQRRKEAFCLALPE
jgi:FkbM family methyltransferase